MKDMSRDGQFIPSANIDKTAPVDEKFFKKLQMLKDNTRNENFVKHDLCDKLVMIDKIEKHLHGKKLETSAMGLLGPKQGKLDNLQMDFSKRR